MENNYNPKPFDTDKVVMNNELLALVEMLAENAHDIWAQQRIAEGWTFGPRRCDEGRHHPCLVHYAELPESEKAYDRNAVLTTIRLILTLGYTISGSKSAV